MANIYDMADTWNAGATTFTAIKMNVTDTASASASLLMDLQVGGSSKFKVAKDGAISISGSSNYAGMSVSASGSTGYLISGGNQVLSFDLNYNFRFGNNSASFGWNDAILTRRTAANLRLGATDAASPVAQTLSVQSVVAGTTDTAGANFTIAGSQGTGSGAGGSIIFQVAPAGSSGTAQNALQTSFIIPAAVGEARIVNPVGGSGSFLISSTANTNVTVSYRYSTGTDGIGGSLAGYTGRISGNFGFFDGNGAVQFAIPFGASDRFVFFGTTSSFPALKRSSTTLQVRLADDSGYTNIQGKLTTDTAYTAGAPTATGYIVLYDSTGTAYKIPAEAL